MSRTKPPVLNETVLVRCTVELRQRLQAVADALDLPVAQITRCAVAREVQRLEQKLAAKEPVYLIASNIILTRGAR
jgi:predicted DNA-binding protein